MATTNKKAKASISKKSSLKKATHPQAKKQAANTRKVARKSAARASVKSAVKPGSKKVTVKKPVAKVMKTTKPVAKKAVAKKPAAKPAAKQVAVKKPVAKVAAKVQAAPAKAPVRAQAPVNAMAKAPVKAVITPVPMKKGGFAVGEYVVYPTHGVGKILGLEVEKIGEYELKVFVIAFEKDKMTLRVPVGRAEAAGLRSISADDQISKAIGTLKGRAKVARGMWSRRAQEYEAKINSGNLVQIAEVVRDLHKNVDLSERSYSERMIYETAMHRLCGEVAAFERVDIKLTQDRLLKVLRKQVADQAAAAA